MVIKPRGGKWAIALLAASGWKRTSRHDLQGGTQKSLERPANGATASRYGREKGVKQQSNGRPSRICFEETGAVQAERKSSGNGGAALSLSFGGGGR